jgi:hypothetical protein
MPTAHIWGSKFSNFLEMWQDGAVTDIKNSAAQLGSSEPIISQNFVKIGEL